MEFSVKSKRRQGCDKGTGPRFWDYPALTLFLFPIDTVVERSALVFDRDLSSAGLSDLDLGLAQEDAEKRAAASKGQQESSDKCSQAHACDKQTHLSISVDANPTGRHR